MQQLMMEIMAQYGAAGIFMLIFLENIFPPIPSEVILTFGGFLTTRIPLTATAVILASTAGSLLGALVLYGAGRLLNRDRLTELVRHRGRWLGFDPDGLERSLDTYEKYQYKTVFLCRMVPILRSLISIPAGMAKMPLLPFLLLTAVGSLIWNTVLVLAGAALGEAWAMLLPYLDLWGNLALAGIILLVVIAGMRRWNRRRRTDAKKNAATE